jgi:hypothetical protein
MSSRLDTTGSRILPALRRAQGRKDVGGDQSVSGRQSLVVVGNGMAGVACQDGHDQSR